MKHFNKRPYLRYVTDSLPHRQTVVISSLARS